jgi:hypothetical protein
LGNTYLIGCIAATTSLLDVIKLAGQPEEQVRIAGEAMELRDCLTTSDTQTPAGAFRHPEINPARKTISDRAGLIVS